ncbi:hypothetical protein PHLCEN_2v11815 [Hermanssonia centrifuga]|uniref:Uncharacterized protein n=1 Tax=Hermanssonia centrifuga TaxID=98765 RepID=A0A2R6NJ42_9APHY|nr:hypothetical protein PHLCEN_2v11815 [Hermanssonia centrifuga]
MHAFNTISSIGAAMLLFATLVIASAVPLYTQTPSTSSTWHGPVYPTSSSSTAWSAGTVAVA